MKNNYDTSTPELAKLFDEMMAANKAFKKALKVGEIFPKFEHDKSREMYKAYWNTIDNKQK